METEEVKIFIAGQEYPAKVVDGVAMVFRDGHWITESEFVDALFESNDFAAIDDIVTVGFSCLAGLPEAQDANALAKRLHAIRNN